MIERLKSLIDSGQSFSTVGRALGVSKDAVAGKVRRLNLDGRKNDMSQMDRFAEALADGASIREAGIAVGVRDTRAREIFRAIRAGLGSQAI